MKLNKITALFTAAAFAAASFVTVITASAASESATLPVKIESFASADVDGFSTTAAAGLKTDNGYLAADKSDNISAGNEFMTINIGSGFSAKDVISVGFTFTNSNQGTKVKAQVYSKIGASTETQIGETAEVAGYNDDEAIKAPKDFNGIITIPDSYSSNDSVKIILKVSAACNTPRIKNVDIHKVNTSAEASAVTLPVDYPSFSEVPQSGFSTTHSNLKVSSGYLETNTDEATTSGNVPAGYEFMTINLGNDFKANDTVSFRYTFSNGNGWTKVKAQAYYQVGYSTETYIGETGEAAGTYSDQDTYGPKTLSDSFTIPQTYNNENVKLILKVSAQCNSPKITDLHISKAENIIIGEGTEVTGTEDKADTKSTYYVTTITPSSTSSYTTLNVSGKLKAAVNNKTEFSKDTAIATLSGDGSYTIGIIIGTAKDNIDTLSVTLK